MPKDEVIAALEKATARLPAAFGGAMCALFMFGGVKVLAQADTWASVAAIGCMIVGFACAFNCCLAALATERGEAGR